MSHAARTADVDRLEKTFDGFTFYTFLNTSDPTWGTQAFLINMRRERVHRWEIRLKDIWPKPPHLDTSVRYPSSNFFGSYLYPNGDLLVTFHGDGQTSGCGLAKIDANSKLLWAYPANIHHDVDVAEDGTIYAVRQDFLYEPPPGMRMWNPALVDCVLTLSPDGQPLREPISVIDAFRNSPYAALLAPLEKSQTLYTPPPGSPCSTRRRTYRLGQSRPLAGPARPNGAVFTPASAAWANVCRTATRSSSTARGER